MKVEVGGYENWAGAYMNLIRKGFTAKEAMTIIEMAIEYQKPNNGKWQGNT